MSATAHSAEVRMLAMFCLPYQKHSVPGKQMNSLAANDHYVETDVRYFHGSGGSARSHVPKTAGSLISITSRSSERHITLCGTPAG